MISKWELKKVLNTANIEENWMCFWQIIKNMYVISFIYIFYRMLLKWNWVLKIFAQYNKWFIWIVIDSFFSGKEQWHEHLIINLKGLKILVEIYWNLTNAWIIFHPDEIRFLHHKFLFIFIQKFHPDQRVSMLWI